VNSRILDADYLREQYEALRREALAVSPEAPRGHGLMLFLTRGMVAWIEALSTLTSRHPLGAQEVSTLPVAVRPEIATLLANMILVCMGEEQHA
jgi:hypothetical protein